MYLKFEVSLMCTFVDEICPRDFVERDLERGFKAICFVGWPIGALMLRSALHTGEIS